MKRKCYTTSPSSERNILGLNGLNHDSTATLLNGKEIMFSGHSERYSEIKNDENLSEGLLNDLSQYGEHDTIVWFENKPLEKPK